MKLTLATVGLLLLAGGAQGAEQVAGRASTARKLAQNYAKTPQIAGTDPNDPVQNGINYLSASGQVANWEPWPFNSWPNLQGTGPNAFKGPQVMNNNVGTEVAAVEEQQTQQQQQQAQQLVEQENQQNQQDQSRTQQQVSSRQNTQAAKQGR